MDFAFDDDQVELQAAVADVLAKECPPAYLRTVVEDGHDAADLWATLVSLDWPALAIPAADGGVGGASFLELAIVLEQLGAVADPTPFLATTTQFAPLVAACGTPEQRKRFLGAVVGGTTGSLALAGPDGTWDPAATPVEARRTDQGWALSGTATAVLHGDRVDELAVVARSDEDLQAFVVPAAATSVAPLPSFDRSGPIAEVCFDGVTVDADRRLEGGDVAAGAALALDHATTGLALTAVGACQRGLDLALGYVQERQQFGVPIGSFQAVKHKAVDMYVAIQRARALAYFAALAIAEDDGRRPLAASMAKAAAGDAQQLVFRHAIQLFGGIGFTWENDLHLYLRRAKATELLFGGAAEHRRRVARTLVDDPRRPTEVLNGAADLR